MSDLPTLDVEALNVLLHDADKPVLLDVREDWEYALCHVDGAVHIPLALLPQRYAELSQDKTLAVMCHHGGRSARAVVFLHQQGFANAVNVVGGIHAWAQRIDPQMKTYE